MFCLSYKFLHDKIAKTLLYLAETVFINESPIGFSVFLLIDVQENLVTPRGWGNLFVYYFLYILSLAVHKSALAVDEALVLFSGNQPVPYITYVCLV